MSRDAEAKNLRLYDRRTIERNIKKGLITRKDYEKFLKALDDAKDKGVMGGELPEPAPESHGPEIVATAAADGAAHDHDDVEDDDIDDMDDADDTAEPSPTGSNSH